MKILSTVGLVLLLGTNILLAQNTDSDAYQLEIEDILNTNVIVSSNKNESISSAPGIVSTINMESLYDYGVITLKDALAYVPGVVVQEETLGTTTVMIRGLVDTWNQKTLFLLDGIPFWMPAQGEYPILGLPVSLIERIEIIRGPGSVLYGTNASGGIINVVLKKDKDSEQALLQSNFTLGSYNANAAFTRKTDHGSFYLGMSAQMMTEGWEADYEETILTPPFNSGNDSFQAPDGIIKDYTTSGSHNKKERFFNFTAGLKHKNLNVMTSILSQTQNGLGGVAVIHHTNKINYKGFMNHIDYSIEAGNWDIKLYADHGILFHKINADNFLVTNEQSNEDGSTHFEVNPITFEFDKPFKNNYRFRTGVNAILNLSENNTFLFGLEREHRKTGEYQLRDATNDSFVTSLGDAISVNEYAALAQLDYSIDNLRLIVGGRLVVNEFAGVHFSPRISAIYNFNERSSLKALFSDGFNSPALLQQITLNIPFVIKGNKDLKAETVRSFDLAYSYASPSQIFVVNGYFLHTDNIINLDFEQETPEYNNFDGFTRWGVELDYQRNFQKVTTFGNVTFNQQGNKVLEDDFFARFVPKYTISLGAKVKISDHHSYAISGRKVSKRGRESATLEGVKVLNMAYHFELQKMKISLIANNILDEKIFFPDATRNTVPSVPGGPGRTFTAMMRFNF